MTAAIERSSLWGLFTRVFISPRASRAGLLLLLFSSWQSHCFGQGVTASVSGTIVDSTGATVSGANVTARNVDTNALRAINSLENGNYVITQLAPGTYNVTVDKPGFKTYQRNAVVLVIGELAQIDVTLEVGSEQQRVTVTANAPLIQTEDSSVGAVINGATIVNTPLNGRVSIIGLMALTPGVQNAGSQDQIPVYGVTPSIGSSSHQGYGGIGFTLDGAWNLGASLGRSSGEVPPLDGIAEFKMLTSSVPAEFSAPAQVVVVSKSGVNQLHGMLLEFNRVAALAAKSYFAGASPKPHYIRNEFGGDFSGPILIPKLYNGKDRTFFFFNYEGFRLTQASNVNSQMPTAEERAGNFANVGTIIDPLTGQPFPNDQIPASRINPVDVQLQNLLFPLPNAPGIGTNTFELVPYKSTVTRYALRLDHKTRESNQFRFTYLRDFYGPNPLPGASSRFGGMSGIGEHFTNSILGWTHIYSPTLVSDMTGSFIHNPVYRTPQNSNVDFASIIPGLGPEAIEGAPQITIKNITSVAEQGSHDLEQLGQFNASITKVLSSHTIKAGFTYLYDNHFNDAVVSPQRGSYTFDAQYSGIGYADFLLGYPSATAKPTPNNFFTRNISAQYGLYLQDDWRATQKLTINAGIRYDLQWYRNSPYGDASVYVPNLQKVVVFASHYPAAGMPVTAIPAFLSLPVVLAPQVGMSTNVWSYLGQDTNNIGPRLGFAYQVLPKTVVRGAFGIFYNLLPAQSLQPFGTIPFQGSESFSQPAGTAPVITMNAPFQSTGGAFAANPSVNAQAPTTTPYTETYNLIGERELGAGTSVRIGYVGQHNLKEFNAAPDINLPPPAPGPVQPRRFVQPWSTISLNIDPIFHTTMNSLQVGIHKQVGSGLTINAEYQYTRVLGVESIEDPAHIGDSYGNIASITPNVLEVSYSYILPFGQGQLLFADVGNFTNRLIHGWQLSGITGYQGGQPFSVSYTSSLQGDVSSRANRVMGASLYPAKKTRAEWFNPAAFVVPPHYTYGTSAYNLLWGPHYQDWDTSLAKNTTLHDRVNLQLRMDAFNVFNHPNFSTPNATVSNPSNYGQITATTGENRTLEFAAKLSF